MKTEKKQCGEGVVDRISELPDEIIYIILSFLKVRAAAATSLLSHRWLGLWKHTYHLRFNDTSRSCNIKTEHASWDAETCKNVKLVNSVLKSHQSPFLNLFMIHFYINKSAQSIVAKWLEFVWSRQVKSLDLDLCCVSENNAVVLGDSLGEMKPMKYLQTLYFTNIKVSGEDIALFLKNCPILRKLDITDSSLTSDAHVSGTALMLEDLRISRCNIRESVINIDSALNLSIVVVDAKPEQLWFNNVPRLALANLRIASPRYRMQHFLSAVSCFTSQLQKLLLYLTYPKKLLRKGFPQMPNLKVLIIRESSAYEHGCLLPITSVISACPRLQRFSIVFLENVKYATPGVERCPHQQLNTASFRGSCATNIIKSVTYFSDSCDAFQKTNTCAPLMSKAEVRAHMDHLKQLQVELSDQVLLEFFKFKKRIR
ncbi:F-box/LRR-repeat protein At3g26922-like [Salvia splendens]|uniref:F-box/LRR-repeat protein At3g26922-like n=1 Tax=Salvia splendens TaxID=180675 RepID=UPI001C26466D|nr:F-box/LRR-repeat protein At3g26922-like [Salvia splendens]